MIFWLILILISGIRCEEKLDTEEMVGAGELARLRLAEAKARLELKVALNKIREHLLKAANPAETSAEGLEGVPTVSQMFQNSHKYTGETDKTLNTAEQTTLVPFSSNLASNTTKEVKFNPNHRTTEKTATSLSLQVQEDENRYKFEKDLITPSQSNIETDESLGSHALEMKQNSETSLPLLKFQDLPQNVKEGLEDVSRRTPEKAVAPLSFQVEEDKTGAKIDQDVIIPFKPDFQTDESLAFYEVNVKKNSKTSLAPFKLQNLPQNANEELKEDVILKNKGLPTETGLTGTQQSEVTQGNGVTEVPTISIILQNLSKNITEQEEKDTTLINNGTLLPIHLLQDRVEEELEMAKPSSPENNAFIGNVSESYENHHPSNAYNLKYATTTVTDVSRTDSINSESKAPKTSLPKEKQKYNCSSNKIKEINEDKQPKNYCLENKCSIPQDAQNGTSFRQNNHRNINSIHIPKYPELFKDPQHNKNQLRPTEFPATLESNFVDSKWPISQGIKSEASIRQKNQHTINSNNIPRNLGLPKTPEDDKNRPWITEPPVVSKNDGLVNNGLMLQDSKSLAFIRQNNLLNINAELPQIPQDNGNRLSTLELKNNIPEQKLTENKGILERRPLSRNKNDEQLFLQYLNNFENKNSEATLRSNIKSLNNNGNYSSEDKFQNSDVESTPGLTYHQRQLNKNNTQVDAQEFTITPVIYIKDSEIEQGDLGKQRKNNSYNPMYNKFQGLKEKIKRFQAENFKGERNSPRSSNKNYSEPRHFHSHSLHLHHTKIVRPSVFQQYSVTPSVHKEFSTSFEPWVHPPYEIVHWKDVSSFKDPIISPSSHLTVHKDMSTLLHPTVSPSSHAPINKDAISFAHPIVSPSSHLIINNQQNFINTHIPSTGSNNIQIAQGNGGSISQAQSSSTVNRGDQPFSRSSSTEIVTRPYLFHFPKNVEYRSGRYKRSSKKINQRKAIFPKTKENMNSVKKFPRLYYNGPLKRSLPLIKLITDPNVQLDMTKTIENVGIAARNSLEDEKAPLYHVRNMVGSAKNAVLSALKIAPQDAIVPSRYKIVDKNVEKSLQDFSIGNGQGKLQSSSEKAKNDLLRRNIPMFREEVSAQDKKPSKFKEMCKSLLKQNAPILSGKENSLGKMPSKFKARYNSLLKQNAPIFNKNFVGDEVLGTFQKVGSILRESVHSGQETVEHMGDVVHNAKKVFATARHSTPRLLLPYARTPAIKQHKPKKMMLITPRFADIKQEDPLLGEKEPEDFVRIADIMDALGVSSPINKDVGLTRIVLQPRPLEEKPILQSRFGSDDADHPQGYKSDDKSYFILRDNMEENDVGTDSVDEVFDTLQDIKNTIGAKSLKDFLMYMKEKFSLEHMEGKSDFKNGLSSIKSNIEGFKNYSNTNNYFAQNLDPSSSYTEATNENVGRGLPLSSDLFKPFMGRPTKEELSTFLRKNGDSDELNSEDILNSINPQVFEQTFNRTLSHKKEQEQIKDVLSEMKTLNTDEHNSVKEEHICNIHSNQDFGDSGAEDVKSNMKVHRQLWKPFLGKKV